MIVPNDAMQRWRLLLGEAANDALGGLDADCAAADAALEWLYGRDPELLERGERSGGLAPSHLTVPVWINEVHRLFPRETIERIERDAVDRYGVTEIVTNPEVLERITPSVSLLRSVMQTKHLMNPQVLALARRIVADVVRQLLEELRAEIRTAFSGTLDRRRRSRLPVARNFDFRGTVRGNLHRWNPSAQKLYLDEPHFNSRVHRQLPRWQLTMLVDQSGSMVSSVIHSAVLSSCLWSLPGISTRLAAFDTEVVDLTNDVSDPVETLMKVQLGGGTDIARAVNWAAHTFTLPGRSILVVISDFYEGGNARNLVSTVKHLVDSGVTVIGLAALDQEAHPDYDEDVARRLVNAGAEIGAMTPGEFATWLAGKVRR